jgi:hypothetical protein
MEMTIRSIRNATVATILAVASCSEPQTKDEATPATADHKMHAPPGAQHEMHGPGPELLLLAALHHIDLSADQRTTIENTAFSVKPSQRAHGELRVEIAAGVRAGHLDQAEILAKLELARANGNRSVVAALTTLHDTLDPDQWRALVDSIATHLDQRASAHGAPVTDPHPMLQHLISGLNLRDEQRASIDKILADQHTAPPAATDRMHAFHTDLRARLETFASARFDADAFVGSFNGQPASGMRDHAGHVLQALAAILPVLDQAQRESLAAKIETSSEHDHE